MAAVVSRARWHGRRFVIQPVVKLRRSFWLLLVTGVALRCAAINQPLVDAHLLRQCQTAAATKSLIEHPGFHLSSKIPWLGDMEAYYVQELPIYNYLVIGVNWFSHNLDLSGKVASMLLWVASFLCLQFIWRRILIFGDTFWANLLFVIAPLSVFFGQAFMPEMLIQLLSFAFVLLALRYSEKSILSRWIACSGIGLIALLVKFPECAHLYLIPAFLIFRAEGWRAIIRPRYILAALLTIIALKMWSDYVDSINGVYMPDWTSGENLRRFVGSFASRLQLKPWAMIFLYLSAFIFAGPAGLAAAYGLWTVLRTPRKGILGLWLISLMLFYLIWFGTSGTGQSYYNLPALAPLCALFAIGVSGLLSIQWLRDYRLIAGAIVMVAVTLPAVPIWKYLFKQDRQLLAAARWTKENTQPKDIILFRPNHHWSVIDYPPNATLAYYSGRPTFVWTGNTPQRDRNAALERAAYAIVTMPHPVQSHILAIINRLRGVSDLHPESVEWLERSGFKELVRQDDLVAFKRE
jgi:hypothetical protein